METKLKVLQTFANWFNKLSKDKQSYILSCANFGRTVELDANNTKRYKKYRNEISQLIIDKISEQVIVQGLIDAGLNENHAKKLYEYFNTTSQIIIDLRAIKKTNKESLEKILHFIINKKYIYQEYTLYRFGDVAKMAGLENKKAREVIRFINHHISLVCSRFISPNSLKEKFMKDYDLSQEISDLIVENIEKNLDEMEKTRLMILTEYIYEEIKKTNSYGDTNNK